MFTEMLGNSYLFGANAPFIEALYDRYLEDPNAVEPRWRAYFDELQRRDDGARDVSHVSIQEHFVQLARQRRVPGITAAATERPQLSEKQYGVLQLIGAYRFQGARHANVDPLGRQEKPYIAELDPAFYGLSDADMDTVFGTGSLIGPREMKLKDILQMLRDTYCRTIGAEYMYITDMPQKRWVQERLETIRATPGYDAAYKKAYPRAPDRGGNARALSAHPSTSGRRASRSKAATASSRCSITCCSAPVRRACRSW